MFRPIAALVAAALIGLTLAGAAATTTKAPTKREATADLTTDFVCQTLRQNTVKQSVKRFLQRLVGGPKAVAGKLMGWSVGAALTFCEDLVPQAKKVANLGIRQLLGPSPQPPNSSPIVLAPRQRVRGDLVVPRSGWIPMTVFWGAFDADGVRMHDLEAVVNGVAEQVSLPRAASGTYDLRPGKNYQFAVRSQDAGGRWSRYAYGARFGLSLIGEGAATRSTGWTVHSVSDALGGSDLLSSTPRAWTSYRFYGDYVAWIGPRWPGGGSANIYIDDRLLQTVNLNSRSTLHRQVLSAWQWSARGNHKITIEVQRASVEADGFIILN